MTYTAVLLREDDGRYSVSVPALRGCHTWGHTIAHALAMAREAVSGWLEVAGEDGEQMPEDSPRVSIDMSRSAEAFVCKVTAPMPGSADRVRRARLIEASNEAYARLREDPQAWEEYRHELQAWGTEPSGEPGAAPL